MRTLLATRVMRCRSVPLSISGRRERPDPCAGHGSVSLLSLHTDVDPSLLHDSGDAAGRDRQSNRLIATRAAMNSGRSRGESHDLDEPSEDESLAAGAGMDTEPSSVESVFARLVADLQSAAAASRDR